MQRPRLANLVTLLAFCLLAGSVPVALSPLLSRWHWLLDLSACFVAQAMWLTLVALLLLLSVRRWRWVLFAGGAAALAALQVLPTWWLRQPGGEAATTAANRAPLRLLTLNLLRGNEPRAEQALAVLRDTAPDLLFCSELTPAWRSALEPALADYPHRCERADDGYFGVALYSKLPLQEANVVALGLAWAPAVRTTVLTPNGPIGVLAVHTPRPGSRTRNAERDRALAAIPGALSGLPQRRIAFGDFNATPWNHSFSAMLAAAGLVRASAGFGLASWSAQLPAVLRIPIDHVLVTPGFRVEAAALGASFGSDHLPLAVTLR